MKKTLSIIVLTLLTGTISAQSLDSLKTLALQNSAAVKSAQRTLQKSEHQKKSAFTNYFPQISAVGLGFKTNEDIISTEINPAEHIPQSLAATLGQMLPPEALGSLTQPIEINAIDGGIVTGVTAIQPVFAGGQIVNGNRLAKLGSEVSQIQLEDAQKSATFEVENYYWQIVALQYKRRTINTLDTMLQNIEKDAQAAVDAGIRQRNDFLQVQLKRNELKTGIIELNNGIHTLKLLLANITGSNADSLQIYFSIDPKDDTPIVIDSIGSILQTSEYRLLEKNLQASKLQHKLTLGKNMPSVAIGASYLYNRIEKTDIDFGTIFATVQIPISGWWGGSHEVKMKKIEVENAQEMLNDNAQKLSIRLQNSYNSMRAASDKTTVSALSVEQAQENLRLYTDYYQVGTCSMSDLLQAQSQYQNAVDSFAESFCNFQKAKAEYLKNAGE